MKKVSTILLFVVACLTLATAKPWMRRFYFKKRLPSYHSNMNPSQFGVNNQGLPPTNMQGVKPSPRISNYDQIKSLSPVYTMRLGPAAIKSPKNNINRCSNCQGRHNYNQPLPRNHFNMALLASVANQPQLPYPNMRGMREGWRMSGHNQMVNSTMLGPPAIKSSTSSTTNNINRCSNCQGRPNLNQPLPSNDLYMKLSRLFKNEPQLPSPNMRGMREGLRMSGQGQMRSFSPVYTARLGAPTFKFPKFSTTDKRNRCSNC